MVPAGAACCRALAACSLVQRADNSWKCSGRIYRCMSKQQALHIACVSHLQHALKP